MENGSKLSHLLTVRAESDRNKTVFYDFPREIVKYFVPLLTQKTSELFFKKGMIFLISNGLYTLEPRVRVWFFHLLVLAQGLRATRRDGGHRALQFVRNLIVGHKMKLSEGNWQKEIDPTINLIPEAKPHLSRYLSSEKTQIPER